jgi:hypothetical protein
MKTAIPFNVLRSLKILMFLGLWWNATPAQAWGFEPHRRINQQACLLLPKTLYPFYKTHISYMMEHATDADMRRYSDTLEASRHFIDLEYFGHHADSLPRDFLVALERFGDSLLRKEGLLPWNIIKKVYQLKTAFQDGNVAYILKTSADLGHYVADAHVPLHTTSNYNGQLSNQHGIHSLWETQVPKLFMDTLIIERPNFNYHSNWTADVFTCIQESHDLVSRTLEMDLEVKKEIPEARWYHFQQQKKGVIKTYSSEYVFRYHQKLEGMVEQRFSLAAQRLAQLIFTAWVMAGEPELKEWNTVSTLPDTPQSNNTVPHDSHEGDCTH